MSVFSELEMEILTNLILKKDLGLDFGHSPIKVLVQKHNEEFEQIKGAFKRLQSLGLLRDEKGGIYILNNDKTLEVKKILQS